MKSELGIKDKGLKIKDNKGYIALTSVIVMGALLLALSFALSLSGFFARFNILDSEYKDRSLALAEACADTALIRVAENPDFTGPEAVAMNGDSCQILSVILAAGQYTIKTQGQFPAANVNTPDHAFSNIKVVVSASDLSLVSWQEMPN